MSRTFYWTAAAVLSTVLVAALPTAAYVLWEERQAQPAEEGGREDGSGGYEKIGYFTSWSSYQRKFHVKNLVTSGAIKNLTTVQYAFAVLDARGRCFVTTPKGTGSAYDDYGRPYNAATSVDGVADQADSPLRGHFGQLQRLKRQYPQLKINLAIGGWTGSKYFSNAALTSASRKAAVASCVDLFIRGNLPKVGTAGGQGAAKGLFDGIDIDWEWPGLPGYNNNVHRPEDKRNLTLLLAEFRRQLDAQGKADGKRYGLTMFMPAAPSDIKVGIEVAKVHQYLDYGNLQGYDLHGQWEERANHQSNLYDVADDPGTPGRFSVDAALKSYLDAGWPASKMTLGIPMYGRGWKGVPKGNRGLWQQSTGAAKGAHETGLEDYHVLMGRPGTVYRDDKAGAVWKYDGDTWWSYDDPGTVALKGAYIKAKKLRGGMFWSLDGDDARASLSTALAEVLS